MTFYHSACGFYVNSWVTYLAVYFNIYAVLLFAWAEATVVGSNGQKVYNVQQVSCQLTFDMVMLCASFLLAKLEVVPTVSRLS